VTWLSAFGADYGFASDTPRLTAGDYT